MSAFGTLQATEFRAEPHGYSATPHQHEVGTGYFDGLSQVINGRVASTLLLAGSAETAQF